MSSGHRRTFKQELIARIERSFRLSAIKPVPSSCLRDMSTSSLASFEEWLETILKDNPQVVVEGRMLPAIKARAR